MKDEIITEIKKSKKFSEGPSLNRAICNCEKCRISRYRHTHEPELADSKHTYWDYLKYCIQKVNINGLWLEFGVGSGKSISFIAENCTPNKVYGFDSFEGLPKDWIFSENKVYKKSSYSRNGEAPKINPPNVELVKGLFEDTLSSFCDQHNKQAAFIHSDCDLFSSTFQVLETLFNKDMILTGTIILFDEFYNYQNYHDYEYKAFQEFVKMSNVSYKWIAHTDSFVDWNGNQCALIVM